MSEYLRLKEKEGLAAHRPIACRRLITLSLLSSPLLFCTPAPAQVENSEATASMSGTACFDPEALQALFTKLEEGRTHDPEPLPDHLSDHGMELFHLKPFEISAYRFRNERAFALILNPDPERALRDLRISDPELARDIFMRRNNDTSFLNGGYEAGRDRDAAEVGSIDFVPLLQSLSEHLNRKSKKTSLESR